MVNKSMHQMLQNQQYDDHSWWRWSSKTWWLSLMWNTLWYWPWRDLKKYIACVIRIQCRSRWNSLISLHLFESKVSIVRHSNPPKNKNWYLYLHPPTPLHIIFNSNVVVRCKKINWTLIAQIRQIREFDKKKLCCWTKRIGRCFFMAYKWKRGQYLAVAASTAMQHSGISSARFMWSYERSRNQRSIYWYSINAVCCRFTINAMKMRAQKMYKQYDLVIYIYMDGANEADHVDYLRCRMFMLLSEGKVGFFS